MSQVGLREPSSVREADKASEFRERVGQVKTVPVACPKEIRESFLSLANERIQFASCPADLDNQFENALPFLKIEERSTLEEILNSQCRSLGRGTYGESLEGMYQNFESTGPIGRRKIITETLVSTEPDYRILHQLKNGMEQLIQVHLPLDRWVERNGDFVINEEELQQLNHLILEKACKISDEQIDPVYRTVRSLEELIKVLHDPAQKQRVSNFLSGVHKVLDQKIKEYFYP